MKPLRYGFLGILLSLAVSGFAESGGQPMDLSIRNCIIMALEQNLEISIQRLSPLIDATAILQAQGAFDPAVVVTPNYQEAASPPDPYSTAQRAEKSRSTSLDTGVTGTIFTGASYNFGFTSSNSQSDSNFMKDDYSTNWGLTLTQPLLRNFGTDVQLAPIRLAKKQRDISNEAVTATLIDVITRLKKNYYELVFAIENQKVQFSALDVETKLLDDNQKRVQIGVMSPLDVTQAEAEVARREVDVVAATQRVSQQMIDLRSLISRDVASIRNRPIHPLDAPTDLPLSVLDVNELFSRAIANRPDYRQALLVVDKTNIQLKYDQQQRYPQIDLTGTYGYNGMGRNFPDSFGARDQQWSAGMAIRVPLPDQTAEGKLQGSKLQKEKALLQLKQTEQAIIVDVDNAFKTVQYSFQNVQASRVSVRTARRVFDAEMIKLRTGTSTSFEVLRLQRDLTSAQSIELRALADYNIALADLYRAMGTTLRENNVELVR
jgi:outer membrane protein TolC